MIMKLHKVSQYIFTKLFRYLLVILVFVVVLAPLGLLIAIQHGDIVPPARDENVIAWFEHGHIQVTGSEGIHRLMYDSFEVIDFGAADIYYYQDGDVYYFKSNRIKAVIDLDENNYHFYRGSLTVPERYANGFERDDRFMKLT